MANTKTLGQIYGENHCSVTTGIPTNCKESEELLVIVEEILNLDITRDCIPRCAGLGCNALYLCLFGIFYDRGLETTRHYVNELICEKLFRVANHTVYKLEKLFGQVKHQLDDLAKKYDVKQLKWYCETAYSPVGEIYARYYYLVIKFHKPALINAC